MTNKNIISYGYHHLEAGHPDNQKNYRICGSQTRQSESKPFCHRPAGWGTSHPGVGRCKLHGGCSPSGPDHPNWIGGRYAYKFRGRLKQHYEDISRSETNPMELLPELEVQRTLLTMALISLNERSLPNNNEKRVGVNIRQEEKTVGDGGVGIFCNGGYPVDDLHAEFSSFNKDIHLVSELVNDVVNTVSKIHTIYNKNAITKTEVIWVISKLKQGIEKFVPRENREVFIRWLINEIPFEDETVNLKEYK